MITFAIAAATLIILATAGATRAAAGGWPDGPVAAPPAPSPLAASERKLATVREGVTAELKSLSGTA